MSKKDNYYVDNDKLYEEMVKYIALYNTAKQNNKPLPRCPDYIGKCVSDIAHNLSSTRSFAAYPFREELIGDGIENTIRYLHNYNPEKTNPFAYFTQIIYYAFLRRIDKEKKQLYIKHKLFESAATSNLLAENTSDDGTHLNIAMNKDHYERINSLVERFEKKKTKKKNGVKE